MKTLIIIGLLGIFCLMSVPVISLAESPGDTDSDVDIDAIDAADIDNILQNLKTKHTLLYDTLMELKQVDPEYYGYLTDELLDYLPDFKMMEQEEPEIANVEADAKAYEIKLDMLELQYHQSESQQEKDQIKKQLSTKLHELFELKVKLRKLEITSLQEELSQLTTELDAIVKNKEEHITMKLKQITEGDIFEW